MAIAFPFFFSSHIFNAFLIAKNKNDFDDVIISQAEEILILIYGLEDRVKYASDILNLTSCIYFGANVLNSTVV